MAKKITVKNTAAKKPTRRLSDSEQEVPPPFIGGTLRPWSDDELRLPLWLRGHGLPKYVVDPAIEWLTKYGLPPKQAKLMGIVHLASAAATGILTVRREHETKPENIRPELFVHNIVFMLCRARDDLLIQTPPALSSLVALRLDRLIDATKTTFAAHMSEPLNKIVCDDPKCKRRGKHLLPGPWTDAAKRNAEAATDATGLVHFPNWNEGITEPKSQVGVKPTESNVVLDNGDDNVLRFLGVQPTSRSRVYIADNLPCDRVSISHAVLRLIDHGFVEDRGRNLGVAITMSGRAWVAAHSTRPQSPG